MNRTTLLQNKALPFIGQSTINNTMNGSDAESLAAALLVLATRAEISWGSREEDGRKIDLIFSCDHPWFSKERMIVLSQVKSGKTYGETLAKGFKLKKQAYLSAQRTTHSILMLWVDRDKDKSYWAYIHPNSKCAVNTYGIYHTVTPATYFDLARCVSRELNIPIGGKGIIIRKRGTDFRVRRKNVHDFYKNVENSFSPVLGNIELTRIAWRHMFRKERAKNHKEASLDIIPYVTKILSQKPTEHVITDIKEWEASGYCYRKTEHLLKFEQLRLCTQTNNFNDVTGMVRILEEIRYPKDWKTTAMLSQKITRRCVLKTIYHKEKN